MKMDGQLLEQSGAPRGDLATSPLAADVITEVIDLRDPLHRLRQLSDGCPLEVLRASDGAVSAVGQLGETACVLFATDPRHKGGALGVDGCAAIVDAYETAVSR